MKSPAIQVAAILTLDSVEAEKIMIDLAARIVGALSAVKEFRVPAPAAPSPMAAADFLSAAQLARRWQMHAESIRPPATVMAPCAGSDFVVVGFGA